VNDLTTARAYTKLGPAPATVTFFAGRSSTLSAPGIVRLCLVVAEVIDEQDWVETVKARKKRERETRKVRDKKQQLEQAQRELAYAQQRLDQLHQG
jgi:hypothetical protein